MEDSILAPTPRKIRNVSSPVPKRRGTRKATQEALFGEAGQELQTILFQHSSESSSEECSPSHSPEHNFVLQDHGIFLSEDAQEFGPSPPARAGNPLYFNSPFRSNGELVSAEVVPQLRIVNSRVSGRETKTTKKAEPLHLDARRYRSSSWPNLSKLVTSE
ncbi:hypothetical protein PROFUN_10717 [Planoprotostelium fungivorum]|uniref:Uncharacterized protein n=1 Tax=Planoprotostelium fungivorum TaxID=1890364 RepID=A0A2P6N9P1_9EUKA|nr:hypothetical protein PROFUN_10717 [Planoprotostelium fungivorum]